MYLEKLEILGFKSFANKNKLKFSAIKENGKRGITAIVGPNGSGKSNIADAVRWVLGEQSAKTLRGKKGEDIIFSGSTEKSRLGLAEVSIYLKNNKIIEKSEEGELSPFSYNELVITRRLNRNGDSEYLINNSKVRLLDIQMLLAKANIGQKTYSVIGQGMVENFLNTSPVEKKEFFDEATGVKPFQIKRDGTINKLERSYENLAQVEIILKEIKPRLNSLSRQVEKIKKRDLLEKDLIKKQNKYYFSKHKEIINKLDLLNNNILDLEKNKKNISIIFNKIEEEINILQKNIDDPKQEELNNNLKKYQEEKNILIKKLARFQAELSINYESLGHFDMSWLNNKKDELNNKLTKIKNEIEDSRPNILIKKEEELRNAWQKLQSKAFELESEKKAEITRKEEIDVLEQDLIKNKLFLEAKIQANKNINIEELKTRKSDLISRLEKLNEDLNFLNIEKNKNIINNLREKLNQLKNNILNKQNELKKLNNEIEEKSNQGIGKKTINQEIKKFLYNLEEIEKETDLNKLKNLIINAKNEFKLNINKLIGFDEDKILSKIRLLQEEIIEQNEEKSKLSEDYNKTELLLSKEIEKEKVINLEKDNLSKELLFVKNEIEKSTNTNFKDIEDKIANIKNEIIDKKNKLKSINIQSIEDLLKKEKEELLNNLNSCRLKISSQEEKIKILKQSYHNFQTEIKEIENKINKKQKITEIKDIKIEKEKIESQLSSLENKIIEIKKENLKLEEKREEKNTNLFLKQKKLEDLRFKISKLENDLHEQKIEAVRYETKLEDLEISIKNENLNLNDVRNYVLENEEEINIHNLLQEINKIKKHLEQIGSFDPETEDEYLKTKERYDFLSQQTIDLNKTIESLEKIISELDKNIKSRFNKEFKIITEKFNKYFNILFEGGQAKIIKLEEEENNNEEELSQLESFRSWKKRGALGLSGIDIQATPPGKKIQSIAMLSGGERALTAIALICAIINVNPSPFVVLDEVDAALDEANSEKLAKILDDLSSQTQFIIITHNRATMKKAELLYGITMQKDGVSKLLSVKLDEAIKTSS